MKYNYNWDKYPEIKVFLEKIYTNTQNELKNIDDTNINVQEVISYIEEYLLAIIEHKYDINKVIKTLETLEYISFKELLLIHGRNNIQSIPAFMDFGNRIFLNDEIKDKNMKRFYLYQALTSRILNFKNNDTYSFSKIYANDIQSDKKFETSILVDSGWLLLEEALSMEIARRFTAYSTNNNIFIPAIPNEYLDILLLFGMTISNTCTQESHSKIIIIHNLAKQAFNQDFTNKVIKEYIAKGQEFELYQSLFMMGHLMNKKSKRFPNYLASDDEIKKMTIELYQILRSLITIENKEYDENIEIKPKKLTITKKNRLISLVNKNI